MFSYNFFRNLKTGYLAGMALSTPLLAAVLPSSALYISIFLLIPFVIRVLTDGCLKVENLKSPWVIVLLLLCLMHSFFLFMLPPLFWVSSLRDILICLVLIGIFVLGYSSQDGGELFKGFVSIPSIPISILGAVAVFKALLLRQGIEWSWLGAPYPPAGSLKLDYNIFGLSMLVFGILLFRQALDKVWSWKARVLLFLQSSVLLMAAMMAGSRRVMALVPLVLILLFFLVPSNKKKASSRWGSALIGIVLLLFSGFIIFWSGLLATMTSDKFGGFDTRLERWGLAIQLLEKKQLYPGGFAYQSIFSCQFSNCQQIDYPHSPFLTEMLIGGWFAFPLLTSFVWLAGRRIYQNGRKSWGISVAFLCCVPSLLISGETVLSHHQLIALSLLLWSCGHITAKAETSE